MSDYRYAGSELELFREAVCWRRYLASHIRPFLGRRVVEVGAGLGTTTVSLWSPAVTRWVCLEPDPVLADVICRALPSCVVLNGTLADLRESFDTILYVDVLEHVEDDAAELARAAARLEPGGHLIIAAPAWQRLMTPYDRAIGHHRRYDRHSLDRVMPSGLVSVKSAYLDAAGLLASAGNRYLLQSAMPTRRQILFWDRVLVRASRVLDPLLRYRVGRSLLEVRRKASG
ncbi:MAG TPA: methyltransferase domain-containing protein [Thermoanaerobaculia bacterium]